MALYAKRCSRRGGVPLPYNERSGALCASCSRDRRGRLRIIHVGDLPAAYRSPAAYFYKTVVFVWLKKNKVSESWFFGMGFWTRGNAEICLLATRGKPKRQSAKVHQFIISPIRRHSQKPDEARDKIVELMGDVSRIELFSREVVPGWDVWGNEIPGYFHSDTV